ncbi:4-hydroxy-3-methylbut-2-enyl diphosphate reductase [Telmatospirillum siberiense]|uniref:4-hydroxy-3-methylbut-2-enyl diphosphate reductase n=1 Tax=Telmatospirillum siberiense TaxID=382514 RepID=A0A2N3PTT4_9PROT|nr:4-hydroxy-3-methylbut-2-enyl diphosphate reductase [Telmatospirillum siberiense]PKU23814.1 4-hydroxy-3-methylbut-2-enyl diphosphate reductase [Telmatospirillum siberiense]
MTKRPLTILLANPRGFCAGVNRAIHIVEEALRRYGRPVYVRHEIVHNRYVVQSLEAQGAVFVEELDDVPDDRPVVFSAHGVPKTVPAAAEKRGMFYLDATCPLVTKVHHEAARHVLDGRQIIMIGHSGHPEVVGTMGQVPDGSILLVETLEQAETVQPTPGQSLAYITQTTLSVDDTAGIVAVLRRRFPDVEGPHKEDICYATTNRQQSIKAIAPRCDAVMVIGAPNSSNSRRLVEVAASSGCHRSYLVQRASEIDWSWLDGINRLGVSAGASAPEVLVDEVLEACRQRFEVTIEEISVTRETVTFKLPAELCT